MIERKRVRGYVEIKREREGGMNMEEQREGGGMLREKKEGEKDGR